MAFMERLRNNRIFQQLMRVLQFLSSVISLGLFSARLYKISKVVRQARSASDGAVEGILAAAVGNTTNFTKLKTLSIPSHTLLST